MCMCMQKYLTRTLEILQSMLEFGGLWKQQNNSASTKSVRSLLNVEMLKLDTIRKKQKGLLKTATSTFT